MCSIKQVCSGIVFVLISILCEHRWKLRGSQASESPTDIQIFANNESCDPTNNNKPACLLSLRKMIMNHCVPWDQSNNHQRQRESFHNFKQAGS